MKRVFKNPIITFILGALIFGGVGAVFGYNLLASNTGFTPKDSSWNATNTKEALDYLYENKKFYDNFDESNVFYSYDKYSTLPDNYIRSLDLTKGKYSCITSRTYTYNNETWYDASGTFGVSVSGCDKIETIKNEEKHFSSTGTKSRINMLFGVYLFGCNLNSDKTVTVTVPQYSGSYRYAAWQPGVIDFICTKVGR